MTPPPYDNIRVAVVGAAGFIGRWVAHALCESGATVYSIIRDWPSAERVFAQYGVHGHVREVSSPAGVAKALTEIRPSITFNLAGYGVDPTERDESAAYEINATLVQRICEAAFLTRNPSWLGQNLVHTGSALEYGTIGGCLCESALPNPTTLYGRSKLAGARILADFCRTYGLRGLTARLFTVYGPGEHPGRLLPSLIASAQSRQPLNLTAGDQKRDFTYVEDVAEGLLRLGVAAALPGEIVNLATGRLATIRVFAETAAKLLQLSPRQLEFGALPKRAEEMHHGDVAVNRLKGLLGWMPTTGIVAGIRRTLAFHNELVRNVPAE